MSFNLFNFWIPLILTIQIYHLLPGKKEKNLFLLLASWGFYILFDYRAFPCLLLSTAVDYIAGSLAAPNRKKSLRLTALFCSVSVNLGLLFSFKYIPDFGGGSFTNMLQSIGLPLGISFYTFQTMSYTFDCYKGHIKPSSDFFSFALYVSFFPQLAAGPIERASRLLPQFQQTDQKTAEKVKFRQFREGFYLILLGLFKKVYVAGALIHPLKRIFETDEAPPSLALISGLLAILHVYADFSAYSDLARGLAKFFGIELMINFKPFIFSKNPKDFWRRWHISLYDWISNYLVKGLLAPLLKAKISGAKLLSIAILFIAIALWHGASITWLLFGVFNALCFYSHRLVSKTPFWRRAPQALKLAAATIFMFGFHTVNGWLFYSGDLETFLKIFEKARSFSGFGRETADLLFYLLPFLAPLFVYELFQNKRGTELFIMKSHFLIRAFWIALVLAGILIFERNSESSFVYFGF